MSTIVEKNVSFLGDADIKSMSTAELKSLFTAGLEVTVQYIRDLAIIWGELESRGEDLSDLKSSITKYFPLINENKMSPAAIIKYAGQEVLLKELSYLPLEKQDDIVESGSVEFVAKDDKGGYEASSTDLSSLHVRHYAQVFDSGKIRDIDEQKEYLELIEAKKLVQQSKKKPVRKRNVSFNSARQSLICAGIEMRIDDVLEALSVGSERSVEEIKHFLR